ncbi:MAG: DUF4062 domain-containing protein [Terriglobia bacterium]
MPRDARIQPKVMVSSTVRDLPDHRKGVLDACLRQGMFPLMMEHLPAIDADAIRASMDLVDEADIYLGVFAFHYGYVPKGHKISITEMEYNRAVERGIPRLIFLMDEKHPLVAADVETGEGAIKLEEFKRRVGQERVVNYFKSPAELRANVIDTLSHYRQADVTAFHYVSDIPAPPEAYIAHPYTLLQSKGLIGRQTELNLLTDWVAKPGAEVYQARILNVVAIGGMGKSALTWKWFNDIAPQEMKPVDAKAWGRMWWSFYESDATFENFVTRALAYVTRRAREEVEKIPAPDRETQVLAALDREPYLIVLDGLERILIAYARMDAAHLSDEKVEREIHEAFSRRSPRKTSDPRAGRFLQKLALVRQSRVLVSSRLFPADLETSAGEPLAGCFKLPLEGLNDNDAVELWRASGVSGSRDILLPLFTTFGKHPLLIQALAAEIKRYRPAPGDLDRWLSDNPRFSQSQFPRIQEAMAHVLEFALRGVEGANLKVLHTVAAFRMPASYDTLGALLVGDGKLFSNATALDFALTELEDRGLLGWDRRANRYDLHPIVRSVVWSGLDDGTRRSTYGVLETHFKSLPPVDQESVDSLEDLTGAIELYNALIGLGRYDDAGWLFYNRLDRPTHYRLSASRQRVELLEMLFPDGLDHLPRVSKPNEGYTLNALALGYQYSGQAGRAVPLYRMSNVLAVKGNLAVGLGNLSETLRLSGALREAEAAACQALSNCRELTDAFLEAVSLQLLGLTLAAKGAAREGEASLQRALRMFRRQTERQSEGVTSAFLAQWALWVGDAGRARPLANHAWQLAAVQRAERDFIRAARLQGAAALALGDLATADERLHHALSRARAVNAVDEELPALVALAEMRRKQGDMKAARELLDDVWELAERGPYPLLHADALNVLAQIERDAAQTDPSRRDAAVEAATKAYRLAWCDGPPFAYHWGLEAARAHLKALGAPEPTDLPPYDERKYEPMPEVDINPPDEFGGKQ